MRRSLYIVLFAVALVACSQVQESSFNLPPEPPSPGGQQLYGRAISDVGTMPSWASPIKYTTINKDLLQTGEKLVITTQKPAFYQGSQAQFVIYDKAYFYNVKTKTWAQLAASNSLSGAEAVAGAPWKLDKGVFELTMDSRFADGKNFFLVYYCGRATTNSTWDCEGGKWKIGAFEYKPLRINCGDGYLDADEQCERDSDCPSGKSCSSCMCMTPEEQRAAVLEAQMKTSGKKADILLYSPMTSGNEYDVYIGINNTAINPTGSNVCFRTQIKCLSGPTGSYCNPTAQQNNIIVGGHDMSTGNEITNGWFSDVSNVDLPNEKLSVFLGSIEVPRNLAQGVYQMRMQVFKNKDNKACGAAFGTAAQTEYIQTPIDFTMTISEPAPVCDDNICASSESSCGAQCTATTCSACISSYCPEDCNAEITVWNSTGTCSTTVGSHLAQCPARSCDSSVVSGSYCNIADKNKECYVPTTSISARDTASKFTCIEKPPTPPPSTAPSCGNNIKETGEECDGTQGVPSNGACSATCTISCNAGYTKSGNQCVQVQQNLAWESIGTCTGSSCPSLTCQPPNPSSQTCSPLGEKCKGGQNQVYECKVQSTVIYTWNLKGQCTTGIGGTCPSSQICPAQTTQGSSCTALGSFCRLSSTSPTDYYECVAQATSSGPSSPQTQNLKWIVEGVCSTPQCHGSMCAAPCPSGSIGQNSLGNSCSTKGETKSVSITGSLQTQDTFLLAKCGDVTGVTAYSWQEHVQCDFGSGIGSSSLIGCPMLCLGRPQGSCDLSDMKNVCFSSRGGNNYIMACKPTTMSQVQFAQPEFPISNVPAITGAVSFEDVTNSNATQIAIVLIASLGIFIITLLNIIHKEK